MKAVVMHKTDKCIFGEGGVALAGSIKLSSFPAFLEFLFWTRSSKSVLAPPCGALK